MRSCAVISLLIVSCSFAGCLDGEDDFVWPEPESWDCKFEESYELSCYVYLDSLSNPILSEKHPIKNEIWIVELSGKIKSWDGKNLSEVVDLGPYISTCHFEQGLLGMSFTDDFENSSTILISYVEKGDCDGPNESDLILASVFIGENGFDLASI
ncbi:MAG: hypothetical protein L7R66_00745 [Candidatus Thalassarchaeaceae archaeon]|nr:hypothetical protein [Candidatus Thalassarchaeaceae archaeon]